MKKVFLAVLVVLALAGSFLAGARDDNRKTNSIKRGP